MCVKRVEGVWGSGEVKGLECRRRGLGMCVWAPSGASCLHHTMW